MNQPPPPLNQLSPPWLTENIAELSKSAAGAFTLYIGALVYSCLTLFVTDDRQIILNKAAQLPIVGLGVPFVGFCLISPIIVVILFFHLQFYVAQLAGLTARLRGSHAVEDDQLYPSVLNIVDDQGGNAVVLQVLLADLFLWAALPLTLVLNAVYFSKLHDPGWKTWTLGFSPLLATLVVLRFWYEQRNLPPVRARVRRWGTPVLVLLVLFFEVYFVRYVCEAKKGLKQSISVSHQAIVVQPLVDYPGVYWADLWEAHLEGAFLLGSVLKKADLHGAYLQKANLSEAILQKADLYQAHLEGANVSCADLSEALLTEAHLNGAFLAGADLRRAYSVTADQLATARSLYHARIDSEIFRQLQSRQEWATLLTNEPPKEEHFNGCYNFDLLERETQGKSAAIPTASPSTAKTETNKRPSPPPPACPPASPPHAQPPAQLSTKPAAFSYPPPASPPPS